MARIINIEGIGPVYKEKLKAAGISTTEALLERGSTPKGRDELAEATGILLAVIGTLVVQVRRRTAPDQKR